MLSMISVNSAGLAQQNAGDNWVRLKSGAQEAEIVHEPPAAQPSSNTRGMTITCSEKTMKIENINSTQDLRQILGSFFGGGKRRDR